MKKTLSWEAFSNGERNTVIEEMKSKISSGGGFIMNFNMFSDLALSLSIEIEENKIKALHAELSQLLKISELDLEEFNEESKKECLVFLNVSFGKGTGDLKQEIPDVPG